MSDTRTEKEKMLAGEYYNPFNQEIEDDLLKTRILLKKYNDCHPSETEYRDKILQEIFPHWAKGLYIEAPFRVNFGYNVYFGEGVYINFDCVMNDHGKISIGARTLIGPKAGFYGVTHPINAKERATRRVIGKPITIGEDCYIGGSVSFTPGVSVGDRVVIGTGSVVCKDIPSDCVAVGNPCHVIKKLLSEEDRSEAAEKFASS